MKIVLKIALISFVSFMIIACHEKDSSGRAAPPISPERPIEPVQPINCQSFQDFNVLYQAMLSYGNRLEAQSRSADRIVIGSALFAEHLMRSYALASKMNSYSKEVQAMYLRYFNWIFDSEGFVRSKPLHPQTNYCLRKG